MACLAARGGAMFTNSVRSSIMRATFMSSTGAAGAGHEELRSDDAAASSA